MYVLPFGSAPYTRGSHPDEPNAQGVLGKHKAMVRYIDKMVGQLVKEIDDLGIRDRTILIFTTDNGSAPPPRGVIGRRNGKEVIGSKGTELEAGVCAPLLSIVGLGTRRSRK